MSEKVTLLYFAWVREKIGKSSETVLLPDSLHSVSDLIEWLKQKDEGYALAFEQSDKIKVAIDQDYIDHDSALGSAKEIAFFPPVTGG